MKKTITPGDGDRHGTANGYGNLGCRCTACRGAWADYFASRASKPRVLAGNDPRHGTPNGYRYWHCRCVECLDALAAEARDRRRRKRGGAVTVIRQVTCVRCDGCQRAWIYPEGDIDAFLVAHEWVVDGGRHVCPCCARKA